MTDEPEIQSNRINSKGLKVRLIIGVTAVIFIGLNSYMNLIIVADSPICIKDTSFTATVTLNKYMKENIEVRNLCLILSSLLLDITVILLAYAWIKYGKGWRPLFTLLLFYLLRYICNMIFSVKIPDDSLWEYPGFPSLIVSYQKSADYFYSGYVGLNLICCVELYKLNFKYASILAFIELAFQIFILIVLRGNYLVDIIASLYAAHYFCYISEFYSHKFNEYVDLNYDDNLEKDKMNLADKYSSDMASTDRKI